MVVSPARSGADNMSLDAGMLNAAVECRRRLPLLRLYGWAGPTLSVGSNQVVDAALRARCRQAGVELVRRPTGGSAVLHGADLTYAVAAPYAEMAVMDAYRWVARGLIAGLEQVGLRAQVVRHRGSAGPLLSRTPQGSRGAYEANRGCFSETVGADLQVGGRKICGSAQKRRRGWFLQHGSIPLQDERARIGELLGTGSRDDSTWLGALRPGITPGELQHYLVRGFQNAWGDYVQLEEGDALPLSEIKRKGSAKVVLA